MIDVKEDDPIFCLINYLLSLALHDDAFDSELVKVIKKIF